MSKQKHQRLDALASSRLRPPYLFDGCQGDDQSTVRHHQLYLRIRGVRIDFVNMMLHFFPTVMIILTVILYR